MITHAKDMNVTFDKLFNLAPLPEETSKVSDLNKTDFKLKKKTSFNDFNNNNDDVDGYQSKKRSMSTASESRGMARYASIGSTKKKDSYLAPSESYVMLSRSHENGLSSDSGDISNSIIINDDRQQRASISYRLKVTNRLFDLMNSRSELSHPMCQECTEMLLDSLSKQLTDTSKERDCYKDFLKKMNGSIISDEETEKLQKEIQEASH
nr:6284_t:CDS:1 [Entrophospora candida]